jgi:hypothetical protein
MIREMYINWLGILTLSGVIWILASRSATTETVELKERLEKQQKLIGSFNELLGICTRGYASMEHEKRQCDALLDQSRTIIEDTRNQLLIYMNAKAAASRNEKECMEDVSRRLPTIKASMKTPGSIYKEDDPNRDYVLKVEYTGEQYLVEVMPRSY